MVRAEKTDRNVEIFKERLSGMYLKTIAEKHGISVTRVKQIIDDVEQKDKVDFLGTTINYQGRHPEDVVQYLYEHGYKYEIHSGDESKTFIFKIWGRSINSEIKVLQLDTMMTKEAADV